MTMCEFCAEPIQHHARVCPHCGRDLHFGHIPPGPPTRVTLTDLDLPFRSMVWFMVKWTTASIPALLILVGVALFVGMVWTLIRALFV